MKSFILVFTLMCLTAAVGQESITKELESFNRLEVTDLIEVTLVKSTENKAELYGLHKHLIIIIVRKGILKIRMNPKYGKNGSSEKVTLYYNNLDFIEATHGARIVSKETIKQDKLELKVEDRARINLELDVNNAIINTLTRGEIRTSGKANHQKVSVSSEGLYIGTNMETKNTSITVLAIGTAYIHATDIVDASVKAGGLLTIAGKPKEVNDRSGFSGKIVYAK